MKYLFCFLGLLLVFSCKSQVEKEPMKEYKYKTDKRPLYVIGLNVPGPYELYINDIAAEKEYSPGMHNLGVDINPYVLKSGKYKFKLRVFPMPSELEKGGIQPHTAASIKVSFDTGEKNDKEGLRAKPGSYKLLMQYPVPVIDKPVPFLDIEGEFEVVLPYELEGWSKGQDLAKMDKDQLKERVVRHYQKLWNILNNGEGEKYMELWRKADNETLAFNYSNIEKFKTLNEEGIATIIERKGRMAPIEDYKMHIYGDGKLVSLERESHTEEMNNKPLNAKGESPLIRKGLIRGVSYYPVILYLPEGSDEFVIIRK